MRDMIDDKYIDNFAKNRSLLLFIWASFGEVFYPDYRTLYGNAMLVPLLFLLM